MIYQQARKTTRHLVATFSARAVSAVLKDFDIDYIFHFGSPSSVVLFMVLFNMNAQECILRTIFGFRNVMEYAKRKGISRVIYPSSGSVYGDTPKPQSEARAPYFLIH
jgi:nucleoside-diphosphate-sugar epimerase